MVVFRCTRKLLDRIGAPIATVEHRSTTRLGDWYATLVFARPQQLVLAISENSRLPVLVAARELTTLRERFSDAVALILRDLDVCADAIKNERAAMQDFVIGATQSRSLLGSLNDYTVHVKWSLVARPELTLHELSLDLAGIPLSPLGYKFPREIARESFAKGHDGS
jgi:hypothetical protein